MGIFSWRKKKKSDDEVGEMSFLDHLEELRWHIFRSVVAIVLFGIVLFSFRTEVIGGIFMSPFKKDFITYQFLCEQFGQFCESDIQVESVQVIAPDSVLLNTVAIEQVTVPQWTLDTIYLDTLGNIQVDSIAAPAVVKTVRTPLQLKVAVDELVGEGQMKGFSVETDSGSVVKFQAISPYEQFMKSLFYAFFGGLIFAFPYVSWELWNFIKPALSRKESRAIRWNVLNSSLLFFFGIAFGYFVILPFSVRFLSNFVLFEEAANIWRIGDVVNFVLLLLFGTGFLFQLPVVVFYLSKIGLTSPRGLRKYRKHAVVALLVIAAIVTPPDPMSQILIFVPLLTLYEVGIVISGRVEKKRLKKEKEEREKDEEYRKKKIEELRKQAEAEKAAAEKEKAAEEKAKAAEAAEEPETQDEEEDEEDDGPELGPPPGTFARE